MFIIKKDIYKDISKTLVAQLNHSAADVCNTAAATIFTEIISFSTENLERMMFNSSTSSRVLSDFCSSIRGINCFYS